MNDSAAARTGEFLRIAISFLWNRPNGASTRELMEAIAHSAHLTAEEAIPLPGGEDFRQYEVTARAALAALEKAGWLAREESLWTLTETGRLVCKDFRQAEDFYLESLRLLAEPDSISPLAQLTLEVTREVAHEQVRSSLLSLPRHAFRSLVSDLLLAMGHSLEWVAPPDKARGNVDIIARPSALPASDQRLMVQIRHAAQVMDVDDLRMLVSEAHPDYHLLCLSSGGFSPQALEFASLQAENRLVLMDLDKFISLWIEYNHRLSADARRRLPLETVNFLSMPGSPILTNRRNIPG